MREIMFASNSRILTPHDKQLTDSSNFSFIDSSGFIGMAEGKSKSEDMRNAALVLIVVVVDNNAFDRHDPARRFCDGDNAAVVL